MKRRTNQASTFSSGFFECLNAPVHAGQQGQGHDCWSRADREFLCCVDGRRPYLFESSGGFGDRRLLGRSSVRHLSRTPLFDVPHVVILITRMLSRMIIPSRRPPSSASGHCAERDIEAHDAATGLGINDDALWCSSSVAVDMLSV